jgi:large subunit ribosomal protein L24
MHVRKDDMVQVLRGDDAERGRARKVLRVLPDENKVVVEGVNRVYKHVKPNRRNPQGGRLSKEMPISASNVLLYCPTCRRGVRLGRRYTPDGRKERYCKKCGSGLGTLAKGRTKYVPRA